MAMMMCLMKCPPERDQRLLMQQEQRRQVSVSVLVAWQVLRLEMLHQTASVISHFNKQHAPV